MTTAIRREQAEYFKQSGARMDAPRLESELLEQFAIRLEKQGYTVIRNAKARGELGEEHTFKLLASKDDGFIAYSVAVGISVSRSDTVSLAAIFDFAEKAFDAGIHYKVFIAIPVLAPLAASFAQKRGIRVFDQNTIYQFLNSGTGSLPAMKREPIVFTSKKQFLDLLASYGYTVEENVSVKGASGAQYTCDLLAGIDDGLIFHKMGIDFVSSETEVGLEQLSLIDAKARDAGITFEVIVASPKLSDKARGLASRRHIKVFEVSRELLEETLPSPPLTAELINEVAKETEVAEPIPLSVELTPDQLIEGAQSVSQISPEPETIAEAEAAPLKSTFDEPSAIVPMEAAPDTHTAKEPPVAITLDFLLHAPTPEALQLVPERIAREHNVMPLAIEDNTLWVSMANTNDIIAIDDLSALTRKRIHPVQASEADIKQAIDFHYQTTRGMVEQPDAITEPTQVVEAERAEIKAAEAASDDRMLEPLISDAVKSRATDIHIQPEQDKVLVRYRIDGMLHDIKTLPADVHLSLVSRLKMLAHLNPAESRRLQDGGFSFNASGKDIDVRLATIGTAHGEMALLRLVDKSQPLLSLSELGFLPEDQEKFEHMLMASRGLIMIAGPAAIGKTTTLNAAIDLLRRAGRGIVTFEEHIEHRFDGVNQIQIDPKLGLTLASGLRTLESLNPDVIVVSEIRDSGAANLVTKWALGDLLALTTVHAKDSISALFRLIELGVDRLLACSAVIGIVAQRMVRRVCPYCARRTTAPSAEREAYHRETGEEESEFDYGAGCPACSQTGYLGRTGIFEVLSVTEAIRRSVLSGAKPAEIRSQAIAEGMIPLARDGMLKAKAGITTPCEVLRNAY